MAPDAARPLPAYEFPRPPSRALSSPWICALAVGGLLLAAIAVVVAIAHNGLPPLP